MIVTNSALYQSTPSQPFALPGQIAATLCFVSLLVLYLAEARGLRVWNSTYAGDDILLFVPHLLCLTLLAAGMNRVGGALAAITAVFFGLFGALYALASLLSSQQTYGAGFLMLVQVALLIAGVLAARTRSSFPDAFPTPRQGIALLGGVAIWLVLGPALRRMDEPRVKQQMAEATIKRAATNSRIAEGQFLLIAQCLQRYAPADSSAYYPATLRDLATTPGCAQAADAPQPGYTLQYEASAPNAAGRRTSFRLVAGWVESNGGRHTMTTDQSEWITVASGVGVNHYTDAWSSPLAWLEPIANCIERARDADSTHRYSPTIGAAARRQGCSYQFTGADSAVVLLGGPRGRYVARYTPPSHVSHRPGGYTLSLTPQRDSLGRAMGSAMRSYLVDSTGAIHITLRPRPAAVGDSVLPFCPERRLAVVECNQYVPRQRWGVASELPRVMWTSRGKGLVAVGDTVYFDPQYEPVTAEDSVAEYRFAWRATDPDSVVPVHSRRSVAAPFGRDVIFHLPHVYREPGLMSLRFSVLTRGAERYEYRDSIRVLPHAVGRR